MLNKKKHKLIELKTSVLVDSLFIGNYKTKHKGRGIEFVDYKEYGPEDNVKNIDFIKSAKEGKTLVKLYEEERELSVYFIFDFNENFYNDSLSNIKIDIFYEIFYLIGLSAIKQGDKLGAFIFNDNINKLHYAKKGKQNFINIVQSIEKIGLETSTKKKNIFKTLKDKIFNKDNNIIEKNMNGLNYFNSLKIKNSLVFYISDKLEIEKKHLEVLSIKNDLIFCNIFDSFENTLDGKGISGISYNNKGLYVDLDNKKKKDKYIELRKNKINKLRKKIIKSGSKYILLDETKNIYKEIYKLFQK